MKCTLVGILAFFVSVGAQAQSINIPVVDKSFDLGSVVEKLMPCYIVARGEGGTSPQLAGALYQLPWSFHDKAGTPFVEPSPGLAWETSSGIGGPIFTIGIRADNLYARAMNQSQWLKDHYTSPKAPYVKLGPFVGYISRIGFLYGGFISIGLGGK